MAIPTAIGDSLTAVLALLAFVTLHRRHRIGLLLGWACTVFGIADGAHAVTTAARLQVAENLHAQWFVPVINVPLMAVCHATAIASLRRVRS